MEIVSCSDHNFIMPLGIMLKSLSVHNRDERVCVHVIVDSSVTEEDKQSLQGVLKEEQNHTLVFYLIDGNDIDRFPELGKVNPHVSKASYYRLFMTDFLPEDIQKVLYLDGDLIVRGSLKELWNVDIENYPIAAVMDQCEASISNYNRMHYAPHLGYFNAGVALLNLSYWRQHHAKASFLQMIEHESDKIRFHDQDVLNYVFRENKLMLPLKYNVQTSFYHDVQYVNFDYWKVCEELETAIQDPIILHFSSGLKPWYNGCPHPLQSEFIKYKNMTEWKGSPLMKQPIQFKTKVKKLLEKVGFISKEPDFFRKGV